MEYDDGPATQPGEDLSIGHQDLGAATYDSDGDGTADSVIMAMPGDQVDVLADTNHDGQVDTVYQVNDDGSVTVMQPDASGSLVEVGTGHVDDQGHIEVGGSSPAPTPGDTHGHTDDTGDQTGHPTGGTGDITLDENGQPVDVGAPTVDLTGDGTNETVVLQGPDGSTVLVSDADGDGNADHIIEIHADHTVTFAVPDGHGGWVVDGTGHVDSQGNITEDSKDGAGEPYTPPAVEGPDHGGTGGPTGTSDHTGGTGGTDTGDHTGGAPDTGSQTSGGGEDISVTIQGQTYDVGHPTIDSDGNGSPDTAVVHGQDGSTLLVTDTNGDGTGDQVIEINADGSATVAVSDGNGDWETVATGHVDSNGNLVIDQQTSGGTPGTPATPEAPGAPGTDTHGTDTHGTTDPTASANGGASGSGEDITVDVQGQTSDVGPVTVDSDGNGTPDTAVVHGQDGSTLLVTDTNGDGTGDQIIQITADGQATVAVTDGNGDWETVATGHVDSSGNLVIDQQSHA
jgi:hypothetical protein